MLLVVGVLGVLATSKNISPLLVPSNGDMFDNCSVSHELSSSLHVF